MTTLHDSVLDSKIHGANVGPTWGRQDPGGSHAGHTNLAIWGCYKKPFCSIIRIYISSSQNAWCGVLFWTVRIKAAYTTCLASFLFANKPMITSEKYTMLIAYFYNSEARMPEYYIYIYCVDVASSPAIAV